MSVNAVDPITRDQLFPQPHELVLRIGTPRITRFEDRWRWIVTCIVPRFRRLDVHARVVDASLRRIFDEARDYASNPCVLAHRST